MEGCGFVPALALPNVSRTRVCHNQKTRIDMAHHVQKKAAAKANRYRPKKSRPSDINRKPPPYNPNPLSEEGLPPVFEVASSASPTDAEKKE